jgi:hypothetical protein
LPLRSLPAGAPRFASSISTSCRARSLASNHRAQHPNHIKDPGDASLIERVDIQSTANEIGGNVGPEIGECQEEIRFQGEDLVDVRGREGARPRLLAASLRRAHGVTGDPDDAVPLAEQIQRFDGFLGEANNSASSLSDLAEVSA